MNVGLINLGIKSIGRSFNKNSPTWLAGLAVAGVVTSLISMHRATVKAERILNEEWEVRQVEWGQLADLGSSPKPLPLFTAKEIAKMTWSCYIPPAIISALTITAILGSNTINTKRNAALAALYGISEAAFSEYKEKVIEEIGSKKEEKIHDALVEDKLNKNPSRPDTIIITGKGDNLCYDAFSGRYFKSDIETIRRVQNDFNYDLMNDRYKTLNELYYDLGLDYTEMGRNIGWSADTGLLDFKFTSKLTADSTPCLVLEYRIAPVNL